MLPSGDESNNLTRQIGLVAEANFQKKWAADLESVIQNGNILATVNQVVNKGNRNWFCYEDRRQRNATSCPELYNTS